MTHELIFVARREKVILPFVYSKHEKRAFDWKWNEYMNGFHWKTTTSSCLEEEIRWIISEFVGQLNRIVIFFDQLIFGCMTLFMMSIELILMKKSFFTVFTTKHPSIYEHSIHLTSLILPKGKLTRMSNDIMITEMFRSNEGFETRLTFERATRSGVSRSVLLQFIFSKIYRSR